MAIQVKVRCLGKMHHIYLADNGQLSLCDHECSANESLELEALQVLGAKKARCFEILEIWQKDNLEGDEFNKLPSLLQHAWNILRTNRDEQRILRKLSAQRGTAFLDTNVTPYPDMSTLPYSNEVRKKQAFAVTEVYKELIKRGRNVKLDLKESKAMQGSNWRSFTANIITAKQQYAILRGDGYTCALRCSCGSGNGINIAKGIQVGLVADMAEIGMVADKVDKYDSRHYQEMEKHIERLNKRFKPCGIVVDLGPFNEGYQVSLDESCVDYHSTVQLCNQMKVALDNMRLRGQFAHVKRPRRRR